MEHNAVIRSTVSPCDSRNFRRAVLLVLAGAVIAVCSRPILAIPPELSYFVGNWTIVVKEAPRSTFTWTVQEDLGGEWLSGIVERDDQRTSADYWRVVNKTVERYISTADGLYIKMASSGWKTNKMLLNGIASGKTGDFRVRETIIRENDRKFRALWERQEPDGTWVIFSDETCTK